VLASEDMIGSCKNVTEWHKYMPSLENCGATALRRSALGRVISAISTMKCSVEWLDEHMGNEIATMMHARALSPPSSTHVRLAARETSWRSVQLSSAMAANSMTHTSGMMYDSVVLSSSCPIGVSHAHIPHPISTNSMHGLACQRLLCPLHQSKLSDRRRQEL